MEMARHAGLVRRGARYYVRVRTPQDLVATIGRAEVWKSLQTADHREAVRRFYPARAALQATFQEARRLKARNGKLAGDEALRIVRAWFCEVDRKAAHVDHGLFADDLRAALGETAQDLSSLIDGGDGDTVQAALDRALIAAGWLSRPHTVGSISTKRVRVADAEPPAELADLARRALAELARRRLDRLQGRPGMPVDPIFVNGAAVHPVAPNGADGHADGGITLATLIERFEADKAPRLSPGKATEYQALFRLLKELWGEHKPVRTIDRAACRQVLDLVEVLPPHAAQRWPGKPLAGVAEHAKTRGIPPMDPATGNAYLQRLSTLLRWGEREEYLTRNPAVGLRVAEPEGDPRHARDPFAPDQLRKIFEGLAAEAPWRRYVALVGLFSGARLNEVCGLAVDDLAKIDGVDVIVIRPDAEAGRRLKTASARRIIPAHSELKRCGFLAFVERQRKAGHDRLFPELRLDSRGRYSDLYQKWFSRFLAAVEAKAPRTSYHSFRHNFRDSLRDAKVADELVDALCGWTRGTMREAYGSGPRVAALAKAIARVRYDLDLKHLHQAPARRTDR
jgi:integrase